MNCIEDESFENIMKDILPDIEKEIKDQLYDKLSMEYQMEVEKECEKIEAQALLEYQQAVQELEKQAPQIEQQEVQALLAQVHKLKTQQLAKENKHLNNLQDRYISQNFHQLILEHQKIKYIEKSLEQQIRQENEQKIQVTQQRKIKQLLVKMENRYEKEKIQRDQTIKKDVYGLSGLEELKRDIENLKIGIASMRSQYNVKIKKIQLQIKQIKEKNAKIQPKENINELRTLLHKLQEERNQFNQEILKGQKNATQQCSKNFSHLDSSSELSILPRYTEHKDFNTAPHYDAYLVNENIVRESDDEEDSSSEEQSSANFEEEDIAKPPQFNFSRGQQEQYYECSEETKQPILKLDIRKLLRSNWQIDPLDKYLSEQPQEQTPTSSYLTNNQASKQNICGNKNKFQEMYKQHLNSLNKSHKSRHLSAQAKKTIVRNIGLLGRKKC